MEVSPQVPRWAINIIKAKMGVLSLNLHGVPMYGMMKKAGGPKSESEAFTVYEVSPGNIHYLASTKRLT